MTAQKSGPDPEKVKNKYESKEWQRQFVEEGTPSVLFHPIKHIHHRLDRHSLINQWDEEDKEKWEEFQKREDSENLRIKYQALEACAEQLKTAALCYETSGVLKEGCKDEHDRFWMCFRDNGMFSYRKFVAHKTTPKARDLFKDGFSGATAEQVPEGWRVGR
eukprot:Clim_evm66s109 gene=Clim_evmTU66s109